MYDCFVWSFMYTFVPTLDISLYINSTRTSEQYPLVPTLRYISLHQLKRDAGAVTKRRVSYLKTSLFSCKIVPNFCSAIVPCTYLEIDTARLFFPYIRKAPYDAYPTNALQSKGTSHSRWSQQTLRRPRGHRARDGLLYEIMSRYSYNGYLLSEISIALAI